jgi:hypothetical protein
VAVNIFIKVVGYWISLRMCETRSRQHNCLFYSKLVPLPYARCQRLRWSRGSVLAFGTQVRGFAPGRNRQIVRAKKILSTPSFGEEVKPSVPFRSFKNNVTCKSAFRQISRIFLAHSSAFSCWVLSRGDTRGDAWWRKLESLTQIAQ